ncbi:MAG: sulfite exporter TauE/SafE family protein [Clostridia bacterium]|nr:sulfite exporter TauE/SafE family protein [Clostridia bacterium]
MEIIKSQRRGALYLAVAGFIAGVVNGLLGAGGGILIISALSRIMKDELPEKKDVFVNSLCVMLPISALSCFLYALRGDLSTEGFGIFALPAIAGGIVGGLLIDKIRSGALKRLFAALVIISGVLLITK